MNRKEALKEAKKMKKGGFSDQNIKDYLIYRPDFETDPDKILKRIKNGHDD